ncbi:MAG: ATP-binding protein [Polyangiaceae bacterium]
MNPQFFAGFLAAWSAIYLAGFFYCFWSSQRKHREPGDLPLALFCLSHAVFGVAALAFALFSDPNRYVVSIANTALLCAPALLFDYVTSAEPQRGERRWVIGLYGVFTIAAAIVALTAAPPTSNSLAGLMQLEHGKPTAISSGAKLLTAALVLYVAVREGRLFVTARRGLGAFLGSVALLVAVLHDAVMSLLGGSDLTLMPFGYSAFALGLFLNTLLRFQSRRERLIKKTRETQDRSQQLSRAFKELRAAQTELVRKEQLAAIGELSAVVAHEVRNPLAVITNAVSTLRREEIRQEDRETLLGILDEECARLNHIVGDLLHYAKPLAPEAQLVSVRELVDRATSTLRTRVDIVVEIVEPQPVGRIGGDPMLLRQAIDNLVNNAVQAMPSGGTLTVSLELGKEARRQTVNVVISDTGEGMDTVVRKRALDPFFTTRPAGTGLGLAIVARVVDAHGGQLTIRSAPGAGTEVSMALPIEAIPPSEQRRNRLSISSHHRDSLPSISEIEDGPPASAPAKAESG